MVKRVTTVKLQSNFPKNKIQAVIFDMDGVISDTPQMGAEVQEEIQNRCQR